MSESKKRRSNQTWSPESERRYTQNLIERAVCADQAVLAEFAEWLEETRGVCLGTITVRLGSTCTFVGWVRGGAGGTSAECLSSLSCARVEDFFVEHGRGRGQAARRSMRSALRLFLEFAGGRGLVEPALVDAVPSLHSYRLASLPRGLSEEQVRTVLAAPWGKRRCTARDRAIVFLVATYGVRRGQISALELADIDWSERRIHFAAHKGGKAVDHKLTDAAAEAVAAYLHQDRPSCDSSYVFVRSSPPFQRLGPDAVSEAVKMRLARCGIPAYSTHSFRHAFASRLLRVDQPMKAIADLLGHRSLSAVSIYAKVDYARLIECATEWPEVGP